MSELPSPPVLLDGPEREVKADDVLCLLTVLLFLELRPFFVSVGFTSVDTGVFQGSWEKWSHCISSAD